MKTYINQGIFLRGSLKAIAFISAKMDIFMQLIQNDIWEFLRINNKSWIHTFFKEHHFLTAVNKYSYMFSFQDISTKVT